MSFNLEYVVKRLQKSLEESRIAETKTKEELVNLIKIKLDNNIIAGVIPGFEIRELEGNRLEIKESMGDAGYIMDLNIKRGH